MEMSHYHKQQMKDERRSHHQSLFYQTYGPVVTTNKADNKHILEMSSQNDNILSAAAEDLAALVAHSGDKLESIARNFYGTDKEMAFLCDIESATYLRYRQKVQSLRKNILQKRRSPSTSASSYKVWVSNIKDLEQYSWHWVSNRRMKKVIDKRIHESGKIEYLVSWEGLDNTWEQADTHNLAYQDLIIQYECEFSRRKLGSKSKNKIKALNSSKASEIHVLGVDSIIGAILSSGKLKYLAKIPGKPSTLFVDSSYAHENFPDKVIQYLEKRVVWQ